MECIEFGDSRAPAIVLLHGGGLGWWNYRAEAALLEKDYHVILPILDGHAGSERPFTSIRDNASEIISYIDSRLNGAVLLIGGLSLGGQILLEMLSQRGDICRHALIESAMVLPSRLMPVLIGPAFGSSYGLIRKRWFARCQFRALHIDPVLFDDYYRDTCLIAKSDMIAFMKASTAFAPDPALQRCTAHVYAFVGQLENAGVRRSARWLQQSMPGCELTVLEGLRHGEFSLNHPQTYVKALRKVLERDGRP